MFKKIGKIALSLFMMLTIMTVSYAMDVDNIFGITASAASYTEKATSMIEFYKNGSQLDRKKVSNDELYVFGVFVSNFLMPFQSRVGTMSSDSFVTKMASTFFGDAYTAQQLSDMKYTLGLVQSAQNNKKRLIQCVTGTPVSVNTLYKGFTGFYSPTQQTKATEPQYFTYEDSGYKTGTTPTSDNFDKIVWEMGTSAFDAILGQLISICPSQAGVYMGTSGNLTSNLYIDCFGNISDASGVIIVPACMNPFAFYNKYLDENRKPLASMDNKCPVQLPINNAFWMGTMVTPQSLSMRVGIPSTSTVVAQDAADVELIMGETSFSGEMTHSGLAGIFSDSIFSSAQDCLDYLESNYSTYSADSTNTWIARRLDSTDYQQLINGMSAAELLTSWCKDLGLDSPSGTSYAKFVFSSDSLTPDTSAGGYWLADFSSETAPIPTTLITGSLTEVPLFELNDIWLAMTSGDASLFADAGISGDYAELGGSPVTMIADLTDNNVGYSLDDASGYAFMKATGDLAKAIYNTTSTSFTNDGQEYYVSGNLGGKPASSTTVDYTYAVQDCFIALPNLYIPIEKWTNSTTALMGINTLDGDELGVYFSPKINKAFREAWAAASGNTDVSYEDLTSNYLAPSRDGYYDAWNFVGGTSVPISLVLDDIALFDTYNNFSDSVASSIEVISMYKNKATGLWWAANNDHGVEVQSVYRQIISAVQKYVNSKGSDFQSHFMHMSDIAIRYERLENSASEGIEMSNYAKPFDVFDAVCRIDVDAYTKGASDETEILENIASMSLKKKDSATIQISLGEIVTKIRLECKNLAFIKDPDENLARRAFLATVFNDAGWLISGDVNNDSNNETSYSFKTEDLFTYVATPQIKAWGSNEAVKSASENGAGEFVEDTVLLDELQTELRDVAFGVGTASTIPNEEALSVVSTKFNIFELFSGAFSTAVYMNHSFLQKSHPKMTDKTELKGFGAAFLAVVGGILTGLATIVIVSIVLAATALTAGVVILAAVGLACLVGAIVTSVHQSNSISAQKAALASYYGGNAFAGKNALVAEDCVNAFKDNPEPNDTPAVVRLSQWFGGSDKLAGNIYVSDYSLYGPYGTLGSALGGVAQVYTENGIVDAEKIVTKTGSYITQDVNLWGGVYYAYMVDIFGLDVSEDNVMSAAQLQTNFPPVPNNLTSQTNPEFSQLVNGGDDINSEEQETEKRRELMNRFDLMTGLSTAADYVSQWLSKTLNGYLIQAHNGITGASGSGSVASIGAGSIYTGYSSYLSTATLSEMPFTSWVMEYYNVIYVALMVVIIIIAAFMCISGHRTIRKTILAVVLMSGILLLPRLCIDSIVSVSNLAAQSVYNDRFGFWTYVQHQQYMSDIRNAEEKDDHIEFLIVTNMQQAKDYYSDDKGVTIKWMAPKKTSYWDALNGITGGSADSLNLTIFKWMFQGQFSQTQYSTDPLATYVYRPYTDIAMSARSLDLSKVSPQVSGIITTKGKDSEITRQKYAYYWTQGIKTYSSKLGVDWDIKPAHMTYNESTGAVNAKNIPGSTSSTKISAVSSLYNYGYMNGTVTNITMSGSSYVKPSDAAGYLKAYPSVKNSMGSTASAIKAGMQNAPDSGEADASVDMYYLYSESPYYYFYEMFKEMKEEFGDGEMRKLLMSERFFKYQDTENPDAAGKGDVKEGEIQDFLDLEGLFTFVIPYMQESNYYVDEWTSLWGMSVESSDPEGFSDNLKGIWKMYAPWVDAMYDTGYASGTLRVAGIKHSVSDAINPGSYSEFRPMVFGSADATRNFVAEADMTSVEKRIVKVLENTYRDLMYLNNYADFDDEVLLSAAAMTATFNFNECFSETNILGDNVTLYPTGYEVKNFSYDSFMRMSLMNTTGASVFSDEDIYTTVLDNTSFITGVLLIVNDAVACYVLPVLKLVLLAGLFFLGLLICIGGFLSPPERIIKFIAKQYLLPLGVFFGILLANILISSLFVGEGLTNYVGQRAVTITTGDPTMTILLMLAINCLVCFGFYMTLKILIKSFKVSLNWVVGASIGFVGAVMHKAQATVKGVAGAGTRIVGGTARGAKAAVAGVTGGVASAINGHRTKRREQKNISKLSENFASSKRGSGGSGGSDGAGKSGDSAPDNTSAGSSGSNAPNNKSGKRSGGLGAALGGKSSSADTGNPIGLDARARADESTRKRTKDAKGNVTETMYARGTTRRERKEASKYSKQQYAETMGNIASESKSLGVLGKWRANKAEKEKLIAQHKHDTGRSKLTREEKKAYAKQASQNVNASFAAKQKALNDRKTAALNDFKKHKTEIKNSKHGQVIDTTAEFKANVAKSQEASRAKRDAIKKSQQEASAQKKREEAQKKREAEDELIHQAEVARARDDLERLNRKNAARTQSQQRKAERKADYVASHPNGKQAQALVKQGFDISDPSKLANSNAFKNSKKKIKKRKK